MVVEDREKLGLGAGWPILASVACLLGLIPVKLQTWAWSRSLPLPPTGPAFYAICALAPAVRPARPTTSLSGMSEREGPLELPIKETETSKPHLLLPEVQDSPRNTSSRPQFLPNKPRPPLEDQI